MMDQAEIEFPVTWTYRILCDNSEGVEELLAESLKSIGIDNPLTKGNKSSSGKYITYKISAVVNSREELHGLPAKLMAFDFVKHVL